MQELIDGVKKFEGLHRIVQHSPSISVAPYICPAGFWTIGYGHLCDREHPIISIDQAEKYLYDDLSIARAQTLKLCPILAFESEPRLAAITDFTFNLGAGRLRSSTLRKVINAKEWDRCAVELRKWVFGGGRKLPGLVLRREFDVALWRSGSAL